MSQKSLKVAHEEIQQKIFKMLPEKWDRLYLYASVIDHFDNLQTGEMFFFYYPKGVLKKNPVNVYEVPAKFSIDEGLYFGLSDELYDTIKKLRNECSSNHERLWSNMTISIEKLKYKVEYGYEDLNASEFDNDARHIIWKYKYLETPYGSLNRKEREVINRYDNAKVEKTKIFELPLYTKKISKQLKDMKRPKQNLTFVTEEKIEEMEFKKNYIPKSQILLCKELISKKKLQA